MLAIAIETTVTVLLALVTRAVLRDRPPRRRLLAQLLVVVVAVATAMAHRAYVDGHPAQVVIPLLWIVAGIEARRGRAVVAGAIVGLTAGLETWGVLGLPVLLLARDRRAVATAVGVACAAVAALFGPFFLGGDFRMLDYRWLVVGGSPASLVLATGSAFTWWMRVAQGAAAIGTGAFVAWKLRRSAVAVWAVPLVVVLVRLLFEPKVNDWYTIAVEAIALVAAADLLTGRAAAMRPRVVPAGADAAKRR